MMRKTYTTYDVQVFAGVMLLNEQLQGENSRLRAENARLRAQADVSTRTLERASTRSKFAQAKER